MPETLKIVLAGCGAVSELYYAPALTEAAKHTPLRVAGVFDPAPARLDALTKCFPAAKGVTQLDELLALKPELAIVASPPRFHAAQTNSLLRADAHVLCEKPMAATVTEAESMIATARETKRVLAIGLFRRFFPALRTVKALVTGGALGAPRSFHFAEGGAFNWPAASASFFQKAHSGGGVLLDLGVHALDLVHWWFGAPAGMSCEDDAMGNLEANCRVKLSFANGLAGTVRLSRDTPMSNKYVITFDRGRVTWRVGEANGLEVQCDGAPFALRGELQEKGRGLKAASTSAGDQGLKRPEGRAPEIAAATCRQSFVQQLLNVIAAIRGTEPLRVPGEEGLPSLRLIEQCYAHRQLMTMPWLTPEEAGQAKVLSAA